VTGRFYIPHHFLTRIGVSSSTGDTTVDRRGLADQSYFLMYRRAIAHGNGLCDAEGVVPSYGQEVRAFLV
jgi:hypothetical protein